jgi:hypothetical protein
MNIKGSGALDECKGSMRCVYLSYRINDGTTRPYGLRAHNDFLTLSFELTTWSRLLDPCDNTLLSQQSREGVNSKEYVRVW